MMTPTVAMWIIAFITYPLLASDPKGPAWAWLLGVDLALGLYLFLAMLVRWQ